MSMELSHVTSPCPLATWRLIFLTLFEMVSPISMVTVCRDVWNSWNERQCAVVLFDSGWRMKWIGRLFGRRLRVSVFFCIKGNAMNRERIVLKRPEDVARSFKACVFPIISWSAADKPLTAGDKQLWSIAAGFESKAVMEHSFWTFEGW